MDTNIRSIKPVGGGRRYKRHSLDVKRRIVEQTLLPGASVAGIAREHGINANQVFNWRKLYREGLLGEAGKTTARLLPVTVIAQARPAAALGLGAIAGFAAREAKAGGQPQSFDERMDLRAQAAPRPPEGLVSLFLGAPAACW